MTVLATDLRRDAMARLLEIGGYDERISLEQTLARPGAVALVCRKAATAAHGDELLYGEVVALEKIVRGSAAELIDAVLAHGMPIQTPAAGMSIEELQRAIDQELSA